MEKIFFGNVKNTEIW